MPGLRPSAGKEYRMIDASRYLPLSAFLLLCACAPDFRPAPEPEVAQQALIGGAVTSEDPAVVALTRNGTTSFCTGTLVSPRVILTAAHCIDMLGSDPNASIYFGSQVGGAGSGFSVKAKKQHPLWTGELSGGHDIGMLLMDFPHPNPSIAKSLSHSPAGEYVGEDYRHVGFGVYDRATGSADGQKRQGTTTITRVQSDVIISGENELSVCFGDSGGPAFLTIDDEEVVAGVHSYTNGDDCYPPNGDTNVAIYAADFVLPWIQENDPSCGEDGLCGPIGCTADPDCLPCGPDGTCVAECERPDPDCTTVDLGGICQANSQCLSDTCAAFRGDRDYSFCTRECDLKSDDCPTGLSCQNIIPLGNICYYDDDPPGVLGDQCSEITDCGSYQCSESTCVIRCDLSQGLTCPVSFACESHNEGADYFCFEKPAEGGCQAGGTTGRNGLWMLLVALFFLWPRKRRLSGQSANGILAPMSKSHRAIVGSILPIIVALSASTAVANGRFSATVSTRFQPDNDQRIILPATFGLLVSEDDGASFRWVCEDAVGYGGTYDPDYALTSDGRIYATTFEGLRYSSDGACTFTGTEFYGDPTGGDTPELLTDIWVGEVEVASDGKIWATTSTGGKSNDIFVSADGSTFNAANNWHAKAWWKTLRVANTLPNVVYTTGFVVAEFNGEGEVVVPAAALLFKTENGGTSWTNLGVSDFDFGDQPNLFLEGVSPTNADIVYARVLNKRVPMGDDLYRSSDGGVSWTKVLEMGGTISAFTVRTDGRVFAGTATPCTDDAPVDADGGLPDKGCVRTSPTGELGTWVTPASEPKLGCIGERSADDKLFACGGNWAPDNFAFGTSADNGETWDKLLQFAEIAGPLECPSDTAQYECVQAKWPIQCVMLGICEAADAGAVAPDANPGADAGDSPPGKEGCLGCQSSGSGSLPLFLGFAVVFWALSRRSRKRA